jgi:hypothetical protein
VTINEADTANPLTHSFQLAMRALDEAQDHNAAALMIEAEANDYSGQVRLLNRQIANRKTEIKKAFSDPESGLYVKAVTAQEKAQRDAIESDDEIISLESRLDSVTADLASLNRDLSKKKRDFQLAMARSENLKSQTMLKVACVNLTAAKTAAQQPAKVINFNV